MSLQALRSTRSAILGSSLDNFWQIGSLEGTVDPVIPSLPLITATATTVTLSLAVTEPSDTVAIDASVSGGTITASLAATETSDTVAITGTNRTTASLAVTETSDTVSITGTNRTTASLAATETSDTVAFSASVLGLITASLAATESSDTVSFAITAQADEQPTGGGHAWKGPAEPRYRVHPEYEDKPRKKRKREKVGEQVILAGEPEIQTGIIEVTPARDALGELQRQKAEAEQARRDRLRAIALADDEWLMVA